MELEEECPYLPRDLWQIILLFVVKDSVVKNESAVECAVHMHLASSTNKTFRRAYKKIMNLGIYGWYLIIPESYHKLHDDRDKMMLDVAKSHIPYYRGHMGRRFVLDEDGTRKYIDTRGSVTPEETAKHLARLKAKRNAEARQRTKRRRMHKRRVMEWKEKIKP